MKFIIAINKSGGWRGYLWMIFFFFIPIGFIVSILDECLKAIESQRL